MKLTCISNICNLNEEFIEKAFHELKENEIISFDPDIEVFESYDLSLSESEEADTILIEITLNFSNNVIGVHRLIMTFENEETNSLILEKKQVSVKILDTYILDSSTQSAINSSVSLSVGGSVASMTAMYLNSFLQSDSSFAFRSVMVIEYIYILRYLDFNYPPNAIEMFKNKIEPSKFFLKRPLPVDKHDKGIIEGILELYEVNPYFINNYGEILINFFLILVICHVFNIFCRCKGNSERPLLRLFKSIRFTLVWSLVIIYLSSNYLNLIYFSFLNLKHRPLLSQIGQINFSFGAAAFIFACGFIIYLFSYDKCHKIK